ncbi:hypothetical protein [Brevibacillus migulae]|uniref:hypothetical protein n=1 Tax=Brevibacillus migulae TaxID=1644114 RepID=UPI00106E1791|nr:hypothetical protein [Brevibacillus migulae]
MGPLVEDIDKAILEETTQAIMDYSYRLAQIDMLEAQLSYAGESGLTSGYGIEASLPKPQGTNSDKVQREALRRERKARLLKTYKDSVYRVETALDQLTDDKQIVIIENLMDGIHKRLIAKILRVSPSKYYEMEKAAIRNMAQLMYMKK